MGIEHKITGVLHLASLSILVLYISTSTFPKSYAVIATLFFIVKGIAFAFMKQNPFSAIDAFAGLYLLLPVLGWFSNSILNWIVIIFLFQKGIFYLFR